MKDVQTLNDICADCMKREFPNELTCSHLRERLILDINVGNWNILVPIGKEILETSLVVASESESGWFTN